MIDLTVLALDGGGGGDHLHAYTSPVGPCSCTQLALSDRQNAFVVAGERPEVLVDHVQFVDDLQSGARVVQRARERRHSVCRVSFGPPLVALSAPAEAV